MPESVLFVDEKNTCLSAIAEFAFRKATGFRLPATSAGISPTDGYLHWNARELLRDEGFDFEMFLAFRSKKVSEQLLSSHDAVVVFNPHDAEDLKSRYPAHAGKIMPFSEFCPGAEFPDPCDDSWKSETKFAETYARLLSCSMALGKRK